MKNFSPKLFPLLLVIWSCSTNVFETAFPTLVDGKYDSEFPYNSSSKQLEEIGNSVKMVNTLAFYSTYIFSKETRLLKKDLSENIIDKHSVSSNFFNQTASGTATVIFSNMNSIVLLTCAHIVDFPDTIITYFENSTGGYSEYVHGIAVKEKQTIWIIGLPDRGEIDLLITDAQHDIALLGKHYPPGAVLDIEAFHYPIGEAKQLEWGSFVYVFGYPLNYKMITKGIVSSPNRDNTGSFLVDAVFNKGYSGGIVLAIRDGVPNFELVGMIKSVPSEMEYILKPAVDNEKQNFNPIIPYVGDVYVEQRQSMKYGITKAIPIESIINFLNDNSRQLIDKGFSHEEFFKRK